MLKLNFVSEASIEKTSQTSNVGNVVFTELAPQSLFSIWHLSASALSKLYRIWQKRTNRGGKILWPMTKYDS